MLLIHKLCSQQIKTVFERKGIQLILNINKARKIAGI